MGAKSFKSKIKYATYVLWPKEGDVVKLRDDFWVIYDNGIWRIMTDEEKTKHE